LFLADTTVDDEKEDSSLTPMEDDALRVDSDKTVIQGITDFTASLDNRQASLIVISGSAAGKMFKLAPLPLHIGRSPDCEICIDDEGISRKHVRLDKDPHGNVVIEDLNSTNGTYYNGSRISCHNLQDGDKVQIGSITILKFSYQDSLEEAFLQNQYNQATHDGLTSLYNKKYFLDRFAKEFSYSLRHSSLLTVIFIDLDRFKTINDTFGHPAGDMVLRQMAEVIRKSLRNEDIFARFGGEEFVIVLRDVDENRSHVLAERVRRTVEVSKFVWEGKRIPVTISLGVATLHDGSFGDPAQMLRAADQYLYKAKGNGRNRVASVVR
jgi:two-component system, cell cycle response regulator